LLSIQRAYDPGGVTNVCVLHIFKKSDWAKQ